LIEAIADGFRAPGLQTNRLLSVTTVAAIMEYAMRYFFTEALEAKPDDKETIKTAIMDAVSIAAQVCNYRHPKLATVKVWRSRESAHGARRRDLAADHGRAAPEDHGNWPAAHEAG
jgi:hypothetical protein